MKKIVLKFCSSLRKHAKNITDFEKKIVTVNKRRTKIISRCKSLLHLWKENLKKLSKSINYQKFRYHCHYTVKYSTSNLKFILPNEIPVVFHNG